VRLTLLAAAVSATAPAVAQETEIEQIIVTGSRIASSSLESASPLQVIGAQDIDESGVVNIQDLLLKSPAFGTPGINRTNSNFSTSSAGVATVDLRNLGTARTLVLVNGRRFVAGIPGETAVDLNTIPTQFIERVDILTGGASAVYGSDAIAGVVNIIYKKNFEGVEFGGQYGISNQGDSDETQFNVTMGTNVADGKGNILAHLGYSDQGAVFSRDRGRSAVDQISYAAFGYAYTTSDFFKAAKPFFSSFAPPGRFFSPDWNGDGAADTSNTFVDGEAAPRQGFNRSAFRTIAIPTERYLAAISGSYEIVEDHSAFVEATYASTQAKTELEPFPLASADVFPGAGGQMPIEHAFYGQDGEGNITQTIVRNPLVPSFFWDTQFRNVDGDDDTPLEEVPNSIDSDGDGLRDIYFTRRMAEIGNRGNVADRDTFRLVGGMQGSFLDNAWNYEAFYAYGQTKEAQTSSGQVNVLNFKYALDAVPDLNDIDGDGDLAEAICASADAREQGCVPANIFGAGVMSPEAAKYISAPGLLTTFTSQKVAGLNISGEPFELWAGPVGLAFGAEYREEYARSEFDALQQAGLNAGNAIPRTEGDFHVMEEYFEVNVPLLNDVPFAEQLDFRGAMRFSDYSTVGNTQSWNVGLEWAPISSIRFRAIQAESVRAPNINELYSPPSQDFPTGLIDPCLGVTAVSTGVVSENCRAAPGVNENIAANGSFDLNQADLQGVSGFNRGNPNLEEEKGKSLTVGVVIQPEGIAVLEDFAFTVDYFDIEVEDAIISRPRQYILDQCYSAGNLCEFITRRPNAIGANSSGSLEFIDSDVANTGELGTEGIDLSVTYNNEFGPGDFRARLSYTHLLDGFLTPVPGAAQDPFAGEVGASEDRAFLQLGYTWGDVGITWGVNYIGKAYLDDQFLVNTALEFDEDGNPTKYWEAESVSIDEVIYHDVQVTWSPGDIVELYIGATNLFDENPPPIISGLPGNDTGTETDAGTYDPIGQRFYAGIRARF
jgi:outer membrane receptor protein involved in Fe transport